MYQNILIFIQWLVSSTHRGSSLEGCPIHPTRVNSSLVFAIRLTRNIFLNPLRLNRHESFPLVSSRHTGNRFPRDLENIAPCVHARWVEYAVDSTRFNQIDTNHFYCCGFIILEVNLWLASRVYTGWVENVVDPTRFDQIGANRFPCCRFLIPVVDLRETWKI